MIRYRRGPAALPGGALGTIDNSRKSTFGYDQEGRNPRQQREIASENRYPNQVIVSGERAVYSDLPYNFFMQRYTDSFTAEIQAFTEAVLETSPFRSPAQTAGSRWSWRWPQASRATNIARFASARFLPKTGDCTAALRALSPMRSSRTRRRALSFIDCGRMDEPLVTGSPLRLAHVAQEHMLSVVILASLGIGIGANSAIFSVVDFCPLAAAARFFP